MGINNRILGMAALMKRVFQGINKNIDVSKTICVSHMSTKSNRVKPRPRPTPVTRLDLRYKPSKTIESTGTSLAAKGFLRPLKEYNPPSDCLDRFNSICHSVLGDDVSSGTELVDPDIRFKLFAALFEEFNHGIPNALLHTMETLGDVQTFYNTPVNTTVPLDAMKKMELPSNLHIQSEYLRFHPETDTMFGGVSAFPQSSTIVSGLKYKKKYKGYKAKSSWP